MVSYQKKYLKILMKVKNPIFIVSVGRSGSTLLHNILSKHRNIAWLSGLVDMFPSIPELNYLFLHLIDLPFLGHQIGKNFSPWENYRFWNSFYNDFSNPGRDLIATDASKKMRKNITETFSRMVNRKRNRFLIKITGWPRILFLKEIFPDAQFIHIVRDGRAVANSLINVDFWKGRDGTNKWRWGNLNDDMQLRWDYYENKDIALAGFQWYLITNAFRVVKSELKNDKYLELRYEDFCENPIKMIATILNFTDLEYYDDYKKIIGQSNIQNKNNKWLNNLSSNDIHMLNSILEEPLKHFGYKI